MIKIWKGWLFLAVFFLLKFPVQRRVIHSFFWSQFSHHGTCLICRPTLVPGSQQPVFIGPIINWSFFTWDLSLPLLDCRLLWGKSLWASSNSIHSWVLSRKKAFLEKDLLFLAIKCEFIWSERWGKYCHSLSLRKRQVVWWRPWPAAPTAATFLLGKALAAPSPGTNRPTRAQIQLVHYDAPVGKRHVSSCWLTIN